MLVTLVTFAAIVAIVFGYRPYLEWLKHHLIQEKISSAEKQNLLDFKELEEDIDAFNKKYIVPLQVQMRQETNYVRRGKYQNQLTDLRLYTRHWSSIVYNQCIKRMIAAGKKRQ